MNIEFLNEIMARGELLLSKNEIRISIVIPVWSRPYEINLLLKALTLQKFDKSKFEVIIIDDGSPEPLYNIVNKYKSVLNIRYFRKKHTGNRAENRNWGAKKSKGERIVFLDSDMIPEENFLAEFDKATCDDAKKVSLGMRWRLLEFERDYIDENVIENNFQVIKNLPALKDERFGVMNHAKASYSYDGNWQLFYSHSVCLWRSEFLKVGGFDTRFSKHWGAEDVELGYRLYKSGCVITLNENVISYHIYHGENIPKKFSDLQHNYELFRQKHPVWEVEIFTYGLYFPQIEVLILQGKIKQGQYKLKTFRNLASFLEIIPENTLLVGIEIEGIIKSKNVSCCFLPHSEVKSEKIKPIVGFITTFPDNYFNLAVISEKYKIIGDDFYEALLAEARRISKRLLILNEEEWRWEDEKKKQKPYLAPKKQLLFELRESTDVFTRYYFTNLAIELYRAGMEIGINNYYWGYEREQFEKYTFNLSREKREILNKLLCHQLNHLKNNIPSIVSSVHCNYSSVPVQNRIFWENRRFYNEEQLFNKRYIDAYTHLFLRKSSDRYNYRSGQTVDLVKTGIDSGKYLNIPNNPDKNKEVFTFLWADLSFDAYSNMDILLTAFSELFANQKNIQLVLLFSGNHLPIPGAGNVSDIYNQINYLRYRNAKLILENFMSSILSQYSHVKNIIVKPNILDEEIYSAEILNCDCFININSSLDVNFLVLQSIAAGKKPIIFYSNRYEDYFDEELCFPVKAEQVSQVFAEIEMERINHKDLISGRYFLMDRPQKEDLKQILYYVFSNRDSIRIDEDMRKDFLERNAWKNTVNEVSMLVKKYYD